MFALVTNFVVVVVVFDTFGAGTAFSAAIRLVILSFRVGTHVPVHVSISGEGVSTIFAVKRSFTTVNQNVTIQTGTGTQHFLANPAGESFFGDLVFSFVVMGPDVEGEIMLRC